MTSLSFQMAKGPFSLHFLTAIILFLCCLFPPPSNALTVETEALMAFKKQLKDPLNAMESWKGSAESPCDFAGISCDPISSKVTEISFDNKSLSGELSPSISVLKSLTSLVLPTNLISGNLPFQFDSFRSLKVLNLTSNNLTGSVPDLSALKNLQILDLSDNYFSGEFPGWVGNLTGLVSLGLGKNNFDDGEIPENLGNFENLTWLYLADCNRRGEIPESIFNLKSLQTLDICINKLSGKFPKSISKLQNLYKIELYQNNFTGEIPPELANLTLLREFDISANKMSGKLPAEIGHLTNLVVFQLQGNNFSGELPSGFGSLQHLDGFSIYGNSFSGEFPTNFGRFSPLNSIDISDNEFSGGFPRFLCENKKLQFLLALDNKFSGELPDSYADCKSLERLRISKNLLSGRIADGIWGLPNAKMIDFGDNGFSGAISSEIEFSTSLTQLILQNNKFSGELPSEIGKLAQLEKLYANNNTISGEIPPQIGNLKQLSSLHLEGNVISGSIPSQLGECTSLVDLNIAGNSLSGNVPNTLSLLSSLNSLNLSQNKLSGLIPENLQKLKLSSIDFSGNQLSGRVPLDLLRMGGDRAFSGNKGLCTVSKFGSQMDSEIGLCNGSHNHPSIIENKLFLVCIISLALVVILAGLLLVSYRNFKLDESYNEGDLEREEYTKWKLQSFHQVEFDADEICNLEEENLVGSGSTGKVYRLDLKKNGGTVAVKQIWKGTEVKIITSEMEILGKIRHRNILKLYACLMRGGSNFLVFEFMTKGNLFHALHKQIKGGQSELDWNQRYKIALGAAKGIAYLHHDCTPAIIHRDIKSSNILLDEDYEPKIADFGIAKMSEVSSTASESSCFAGTHGYIAPELAYSLKVTEKSDVYSFGVVLLELVTGRAPIEAEYGEGKDIVYWVLNHINARDSVLGVLDCRISGSVEDDMIKVLKVAALCTTKLPSLRPTMRDVVKMLVDAEPCTTTTAEKIIDRY